MSIIPVVAAPISAPFATTTAPPATAVAAVADKPAVTNAPAIAGAPTTMTAIAAVTPTTPKIIWAVVVWYHCKFLKLSYTDSALFS